MKKYKNIYEIIDLKLNKNTNEIYVKYKNWDYDIKETIWKIEEALEFIKEQQNDLIGWRDNI